MNSYPIEYIHWVDSFGCNGWQSSEEYISAATDTPMDCFTVGFILYEDKDKISLALSHNYSGFHSAITIPKVAIVERKKWQPKKN